ncbi:MAG: hypothetical protein A2V77_11575 [Anaeromyxobacter sp. RBG_16_69_14]|nr:MAG: hypothetical protein A2V77_11575 [Anaeromyxobacter sp. RBG_16_69_14]
MSQELYDVEDVEALIRRGNGLLLAGDESLLRRLPRGKWIAGTIPYFMTEAGGLVNRQRIFVNELPDGLKCVGIRRYGEDDIARVYSDLPAGGFGVMIAPASSRVHLSFALNAPTYERFAIRPLIGWISGVHLSELGKATPKVFDGTSAEALDQQAVVMHFSVPSGSVAELGILNIFQEGEGPVITFPANGFAATDVEIDGRPRNLAQFIHETGLDTRLPLVADYCGANINVSFQAVDQKKGEVQFYAPVFEGVRYRHAQPVADYVAEFDSNLPKGIDRIAFSCNCILNYLHSGLEGRKTGGIVGPITFGEIAYQLLNQTMAYLTIESARAR